MNTVAATYPVERNPLHPDEPCYLLVEMNLKAPDLLQMHRYQLVQVLRGDEKRWVRIDMGLAELNPWQEFRIVADGDGDTVAYVQSLADQRREDETLRRWLDDQPLDLIDQFLDTEEESVRIRHNKSQFGPFTVEHRSGFVRR